MALHGHYAGGKKNYNRPMKQDTRKIIVAKLRAATDQCTDILHDEGVLHKDALELMTKAYMEMAALNALAACKLYGTMPSKIEFTKIAIEVYNELRLKVLQ